MKTKKPTMPQVWRAIERTKGNIAAAARSFGFTHATLRRLMLKYCMLDAVRAKYPSRHPHKPRACGAVTLIDQLDLNEDQQERLLDLAEGWGTTTQGAIGKLIDLSRLM